MEKGDPVSYISDFFPLLTGVRDIAPLWVNFMAYSAS